MATLGEWLNLQRDGVPDSLWRRLDAQSAECGQRDAEALAGLRAVTETQVESLRTLSCSEREHAFELLSTDAMVTYLLELAASNNVQDLGTFAGEVINLIVGPRVKAGGDSPA